MVSNIVELNLIKLNSITHQKYKKPLNKGFTIRLSYEQFNRIHFKEVPWGSPNRGFYQV